MTGTVYPDPSGAGPPPSFGQPAPSQPQPRAPSPLPLPLADAWEASVEVMQAATHVDFAERMKEKFFQDPGRFAFQKYKYRVREDGSSVRFVIQRLEGSGNGKAVLHYHTEDGTAVGGDHYLHKAGKVQFDAGEQVKEIEVLIFDDDGVQRHRSFSLVVDQIVGGDGTDAKKRLLGHGEAMRAECHILRNKTRAELFLGHPAFQFIVSVCTIYALFGTDLAILFAPAHRDDEVGVATLLCIGILFLEILLMVRVHRMKYFLKVMFFMDVIAMIAMLPSVPWFAKSISSALASAGDTGTIARAGRAARAGSRAGRTVKLPKLMAAVGKQVGRVIKFLKRLVSKEPPPKDMSRGMSRAATTAARRGGASPRGSRPGSSINNTPRGSGSRESHGGGSREDMSGGRSREDMSGGRSREDMSGGRSREDMSGGSERGTPVRRWLGSSESPFGGGSGGGGDDVESGGGGGVQKVFGSVTSKVTARLEQLGDGEGGAAALFGVGAPGEGGEEDGGVGGRISAAKMGQQLLELFTGKVIVMMMLILVVSSFLLVPPESTQKEMGLDQLEAVYDAVGGDIGDPAFVKSLAVYTAGGNSGHGSEYNPSEELVYLKIQGRVIPRLEHNGTQYVSSSSYDKKEVYTYIREIEMLYAGGCIETIGDAVDSHTSDACVSAAIFDNRSNVHFEAMANIFLTLAIVVILGVGMALIATDLRALLLDPIERLQNLVGKVLALFNFEEELGTPPPASLWEHMERGWERFRSVGTKLSDLLPPDEPFVLVSQLLNDMEKALGTKIPEVRNRVARLQYGTRRRLHAAHAIGDMLDSGTLTVDTFRENLRLLFSDLDEYLPRGVLARSPTARLLAFTAKKVVAAVDATFVMATRLMAARLRALGVPLEEDGDLSVQHAEEMGRELVLKTTRSLASLLGTALPADLDASGDSRELSEWGEDQVKDRVRAFFMKVGITPPEEVFDGSLWGMFDRLEGALVDACVARLPRGLRAALPQRVHDDKRIKTLRRELVHAVYVELVRQLDGEDPNSPPPGDARSEARKGDKWSNIPTPAAKLSSAAARAQRVVVAAVSRVMGAGKVGLGQAAQLLVVLTDLAEGPVGAARAAGEGALEALPPRSRALLERMREVLGPMLPDGASASLPSWEELQAAPREAAERAVRLLRQHGLAAGLQKEISAAAGRAALAAGQLREAVGRLPSAEQLAGLDDESFLRMLEQAGYPHALEALLPGGSMGAAPLPSPQDLLALKRRALADGKVPDALSMVLRAREGAAEALDKLPLQALASWEALRALPLADNVLEMALGGPGGRLEVLQGALRGEVRRLAALLGVDPPAGLEDMGLGEATRAGADQALAYTNGFLEKRGIPSPLPQSLDALLGDSGGGEGGVGAIVAGYVAGVRRLLARAILEAAEAAGLSLPKSLGEVSSVEELNAAVVAALRSPEVEGILSAGGEAGTDIKAKAANILEQAGRAAQGGGGIAGAAASVAGAVGSLSHEDVPKMASSLLASLPRPEDLASRASGGVERALDVSGYPHTLAGVLPPEVAALLPTREAIVAAPVQLYSALRHLADGGAEGLVAAVQGAGGSVPMPAGFSFPATTSTAGGARSAGAGPDAGPDASQSGLAAAFAPVLALASSDHPVAAFVRGIVADPTGVVSHAVTLMEGLAKRLEGSVGALERAAGAGVPLPSPLDLADRFEEEGALGSAAKAAEALAPGVAAAAAAAGGAAAARMGGDEPADAPASPSPPPRAPPPPPLAPPAPPPSSAAAADGSMEVVAMGTSAEPSTPPTRKVSQAFADPGGGGEGPSEGDARASRLASRDVSLTDTAPLPRGVVRSLPPSPRDPREPDPGPASLRDLTLNPGPISP